MSKTEEDIYKGFKQISCQKVMEFFTILLERRTPIEIISEVYSNVLATHMVLTVKFAHLLNSKNISLQEIDEIIDKTVPIGYSNTENAKAACESIKNSIRALIGELDQAKKEGLH